jgi:hypothetical protein
LSVVAPPPARPPDDLELLIREARARQRKRWLGVAALVALSSGGVLAVYSIAGGGSSVASRAGRGTTAVHSTGKCGIRVAGPRILGADGRAVYREPVPSGEVHPDSIPSLVRCSGSTVWVVWSNGVAAMQEGYVGARSLDRGRTWRLIFAERFFGVQAPHQLDAYMGPWILRGHVAYFMGACPACSTKTSQGTISLWVTKDGGRTFRMYKVPALTGYGPTAIRVSGHEVTIRARRVTRKINSRPFEIHGHKAVTVHVA